MNDVVNCPYCDEKIEVEVSDFYEDNMIFEYECPECLRSCQVRGLYSIEFEVSKIKGEDV